MGGDDEAFAGWKRIRGSVRMEDIERLGPRRVAEGRPTTASRCWSGCATRSRPGVIARPAAEGRAISAGSATPRAGARASREWDGLVLGGECMKGWARPARGAAPLMGALPAALPWRSPIPRSRGGVEVCKRVREGLPGGGRWDPPAIRPLDTRIAVNAASILPGLRGGAGQRAAGPRTGRALPIPRFDGVYVRGRERGSAGRGARLRGAQRPCSCCDTRGQSMEEIGHALGMRRGTVKSTLHRRSRARRCAGGRA